jgi:hypothetical protein
VASLPGGQVVASGQFPATGSATSTIGLWDGAPWSSLGMYGPNSAVMSTFGVWGLAPMAGGDLAAGGSFLYGGANVSAYFALFGCRCYANCDGSVAAPVLNVNDFQCFLNKFAAGDSYANCDGSTVPPVLNIADFQCFVNKYAAGCL